jgi:hypothetical protein
MPRFAVMTNNIVVNVIMVDDLEAAEAVTGGLPIIASDVANIGEVYNEEDGTFFVMPEPPVIEHPPVDEPEDAPAE